MTKPALHHVTQRGPRNVWKLMALEAIALVLGGIVAGCNEGLRFKADRQFTSTVALSNEDILFVDSALQLEVDGSRRRNEILAEVRATITASSATVAKRLLERLALTVERPDARSLRLVLMRPEGSLLEGHLRLRIPGDIALSILGRGGPVEVRGMEQAMRVDALTHVRIRDARSDLRIRVEAGNALVASAVQPGTLTDVEVGEGDVEFTVPPVLSAALEASAGGGVGVVVAHPELPAPIPGVPYRATVNGGLGRVRLVSRFGNVVVRSP